MQTQLFSTSGSYLFPLFRSDEDERLLRCLVRTEPTRTSRRTRRSTFRVYHTRITDPQQHISLVFYFIEPYLSLTRVLLPCSANSTNRLSLFRCLASFSFTFSLPLHVAGFQDYCMGFRCCFPDTRGLEAYDNYRTNSIIYCGFDVSLDI